MADGRKKKGRKAWNRFADSGRAVLVGAAALLPQRAAADRPPVSAGACLLAIQLMTKVVKKLVPERRPDGEDDQSFPSEHAAECVAAAMIIDREYPGVAGALAAALAAGVSVARIASGKHHPRDVAAGAAMGIGAVWLSLRLRATVERRVLGRA